MKCIIRSIFLSVLTLYRHLFDSILIFNYSKSIVYLLYSFTIILRHQNHLSENNIEELLSNISG